MPDKPADSSESIEDTRRQDECETEKSCSIALSTPSWPESEYFISEEHRLVYCPIQKVACSSLKLWFASLVDGPQAQDQFMSATPHGLAIDHGALNKRYKLQGKPLLSRGPLEESEWLRYVFVRNPWSRLVSAFVNKFVPVHDLTAPVFQAAHRRWGGPRVHFRAIVQRRRISKQPACAQSLAMPVWKMFRGASAWRDEFTFRHFIEYLNTVDLDQAEVDLHWRPQYRFMANTRFDFVGRFERLREDFEALARLRNLPVDLPAVNQTEYRHRCHSFADTPLKDLRRLQTSPSYKQFYDSQLRELVARLYCRDIEQFSYTYDML